MNLKARLIQCGVAGEAADGLMAETAATLAALVTNENERTVADALVALGLPTYELRTSWSNPTGTFTHNPEYFVQSETAERALDEAVADLSSRPAGATTAWKAALIRPDGPAVVYTEAGRVPTEEVAR